MEDIEVTVNKDIMITYKNRLCTIELVFRFVGEGKSQRTIKEFVLEQIDYFYYDDENYGDTSAFSQTGLNPEEMLKDALSDVFELMRYSEIHYLISYHKRRFNLSRIKEKILDKVLKNKKLNEIFDGKIIWKKSEDEYSPEDEFRKYIKEEDSVRQDLEDEDVTEEEIKDFELKL